ncbi:hypothetical protein HPB48_000027 [Haemaphysalis longicornis]|uniref:Carboxylesterase type B domain-containing protein n=1 Tax=Haemaphysalis longicornis TaxID=44386 RepID=A0A9J6GSZ2_HAELO|nr:hypothetical protein HPB48_000027 [Haemaphysalis longicornis]
MLVVEYTKFTRRDCLLTASGTLQATRVHSSGGTKVRLYRAVPFGQTTGGSVRFARPLPLDFVSLTDCPVRGPSHAGPPCKQWRDGGGVVGSEDCLNMNVWAPVAASGSPRRTVVVVVTGEWFQSEYNTDFDGADLAAAGDFIVAVPNHRIGAFGFLNAGVAGAVGNAAIEDLLLALSWLQKNAWKFHGDPEDLVALGLGSGAFLLSVILMSPEFNVFRRAFLQGPYPTSPIPLNTPAHGQVYVAEMARSLGCPEGDILSQVKCLRSASENEIMKSTINVTAEMPFVPGSFYGVALTQLHKRAALGEVTLMLGSDVYDARAMFQRVVPLEAYVVNLWTVCFPRIIADEAAAKNGTVYRYIVTKRSPYRIRDVFDIEMVAGFLKNA